MVLTLKEPPSEQVVPRYLWDKDVARTGAIHGDLDQAKRESNLALFREGKIEAREAQFFYIIYIIMGPSLAQRTKDFVRRSLKLQKGALQAF